MKMTEKTSGTLAVAFTYACWGLLTLVEGGYMFRFHRDLGKTYKLYGIAAIFSSVWSIGFGLLPLQTDPAVARVCRAVGMIGVFYCSLR